MDTGHSTKMTDNEWPVLLHKKKFHGQNKLLYSQIFLVSNWKIAHVCGFDFTWINTLISYDFFEFNDGFFYYLAKRSNRLNHRNKWKKLTTKL